MAWPRPAALTGQLPRPALRLAPWCAPRPPARRGGGSSGARPGRAAARRAAASASRRRSRRRGPARPGRAPGSTTICTTSAAVWTGLPRSITSSAQLLDHPIRRAAGREVLELAEDAVALLLVERTCLEREGVERHARAAGRTGGLLGLAQQARAVARAAQRLVEPQHAHLQAAAPGPPPAHPPEQTAADAAVAVAHVQLERPRLLAHLLALPNVVGV